jgi:hypothetical protein
LALAESKVRPIREDRYGRLVAFWTSEFGTLNQVHHIWEYTSIDQRRDLRRELAGNRDWCDQFLAGAWPTMQVQEVRFMFARGAVSAPKSKAALYERRVYRCPAGRFEAAANAVSERPLNAGAQRFGVWVSETPQPNETVEIVAYPTFESRLADNTTAPLQRDWFAKHEGLFQQVDSVLLVPIGISPVQ